MGAGDEEDRVDGKRTVAVAAADVGKCEPCVNLGQEFPRNLVPAVAAEPFGYAHRKQVDRKRLDGYVPEKILDDHHPPIGAGDVHHVQSLVGGKTRTSWWEVQQVVVVRP